MRAHLVQMNIAWEDRRQNFSIVKRLLNNTPTQKGDLIVLPEMFDSGFSLNTDRTHDAQRHTLDFLADLARSTGCTVHGGRTIPGPTGEKATNHATILAPDGEVLADYAKIHPFSFGRETESFRGGANVLTFPWLGPRGRLTVCPAVCYDLRFPELFRRGLALGARAYTIGANWPAARQTHWRALAIARAIENQAFVFAVNRTGHDPHLQYAGGSIAVGPRGDILAELGDEEAVLSVEVDPAAPDAWRREFGAWRDIRLTDAAPPPEVTQ